jgi:tetratricopeptide (TPR) repeat protein
MGCEWKLGPTGRSARRSVRIAVLLLSLALPRFCDATPDTSADELLDQAVSFAANGDLDQAEHLLIKGEASFPSDARFLIELAGVSWRRRRPTRAKSYLHRGLQIDNYNAYANEFLGSLYLLEGNLYAALKHLNRVRRPVIASVTLSPEPPLRPELLERLSRVSIGQLLTGKRLALTERNFARLLIFGEPRFELKPGTTDHYDLVIRSPVLAQPLSGGAGRVLSFARGLPYKQINLDWLNIGRKAQAFTSLWRWDPEKQRIAVKYRTPLTHGTYALWTDLRDENWELIQPPVDSPTIRVRSASVGGSMQFELSGDRQWTPSIHLSRHLFQRGGSNRALSNTTMWEIRNRLDLPRWRYPEHRIDVDSSATLRIGRIYSQESSRLVGAELDTAMRWFPQPSDDLYQISGRLRAGALSGNLPINELYMTAMERDNELWLRGHVGTRNGRKGAAPMGNRFVLTQFDVGRRVIRIPFLRVDVGPFFDIGIVTGAATLGSRGWLYDTGVQATLTTLGGFRFAVVYGHDIRGSANVLYTTVSR